MNPYMFLLSQLLTLTGILGMILFIGSAVVSSIKQKRPEMDWYDHIVYAVFLSLFLVSCLLLIKCGILDTVRTGMAF